MRLEDFEVTECVTHFYFDEVKGPGWRWYCLTCDTGTQVRKHGRRLHKLEGDAAVGAKYHRNQMRRNRQAFRLRAWNYRRLLAARTVEEFEKAWGFMYAGISSSFARDMPHEERERIMREIQAEKWLIDVSNAMDAGEMKLYGCLGGTSV